MVHAAEFPVFGSYFIAFSFVIFISTEISTVIINVPIYFWSSFIRVSVDDSIIFMDNNEFGVESKHIFIATVLFIMVYIFVNGDWTLFSVDKSKIITRNIEGNLVIVLF